MVARTCGGGIAAWKPQGPLLCVCSTLCTLHGGVHEAVTGEYARVVDCVELSVLSVALVVVAYLVVW